MMIETKKWNVVVVTPAGREEYLSIFKKFIYKKMEQGVVDGWQLWQNTIKPSDIAYIDSMVAENPKVTKYTIPNLEGKHNNCDTWRTCEFFKYTHIPDTIFIRFDDDIVWMEDDCIEKIVKARLENPKAFVIYPNVINSTISTSWHQASGALGTEAGLVKQQKDNPSDPNYAYLDEFNYTDSKLIDLIHDTFKKKYEEGKLSDYYLPSRSLDDYQHFSINSICWFGDDNVNPGSAEEPQMSWEIPALLGRPNFFVGDALIVHYAYHTQIEHLKANGQQKLEFYKELANKQ